MPEGFEGPVLIVRNQPCSPPPRRESGRVIYQVPTNGLLLTRDSVPNRNHPYYSWLNKGYYQLPDNKYYVIDRQGRRLCELTKLHGARALGDNSKEPGMLFSDGLDELAAFYETPQHSGLNQPAAGFAYQYITIATPNRYASLHSRAALLRLRALADSLVPWCLVRIGPPQGPRKPQAKTLLTTVDSTAQ